MMAKHDCSALARGAVACVIVCPRACSKGRVTVGLTVGLRGGQGSGGITAHWVGPLGQPAGSAPLAGWLSVSRHALTCAINLTYAPCSLWDRAIQFSLRADPG